MLTSTDISTSRFLRPHPPKAAQLIVTIYGDIVEPRGGVLWMGDLITLCAGFNVNESLVRTAVSRLVSKGQLTGERQGRRSFYALTETAREEYHRAAALFFGAPDSDCDWILTLCPDAADQAEMLTHGFAELGGQVLIGADREGRPRLGSVFRSTALDPASSSFRDLIRSAFQLDRLGRDYAAFIETFSAMADLSGNGLQGDTALKLRLALVHAYRDIRLRDPRLPLSVLPQDWPGFAARTVFAELYRQLSEPADHYIGQSLFDREGHLPVKPAAVQNRLETLALG